MSLRIAERVRLINSTNKELLRCFGSRSFSTHNILKLVSSTIPTHLPRKHQNIQKKLSVIIRAYSTDNDSYSSSSLDQTLEEERRLREKFYRKLMRKDLDRVEVLELLEQYKAIKIPLSHNLKLVLFKLLAENDMKPAARAILREFDLSNFEVKQMVNLASFAAQVDDRETLLKIAEYTEMKAGDQARSIGLHILGRTNAAYLRAGRETDALDIWLTLAPFFVPNFKIHFTLLGSFYQDSISDIIRQLKNIQIIPSFVERHIEDLYSRRRFYVSLLRCSHRVGGPSYVIALFESIPKEVVYEEIIQYMFNFYLYKQRDQLPAFMQKYSDYITLGDYRIGNFILNAGKKDPNEVYYMYLDLFKADSLPGMDLVKFTMTYMIKKRRSDLLRKVYDIYTERSGGLSIIPYHSLMRCQITVHDSEGFFATFKEMIRKGIQPNPQTYILVLKQFASQRDLESSFSLIDYMEDLGMPLHMSHLMILMDCCCARADVPAALKVQKIMDDMGYSKGPEFYAKLMSVYIEANDYDKALRAFRDCREVKTVDMYAELIKIHIRTGEYEQAKSVYESMINKNMELNNKFFAVMIDYFCQIGEFENAEDTLNGMVDETGHEQSLEGYEVLMRHYTKKRRYIEAVAVYNRVIEADMVPSTEVYHLLMSSLVQLSFVNGDNYSRPTEVAEQLMEAHKAGTFKPQRKFLPFRIIQPIVNFLAKYYDAAEAMRLLEKYKSVNPGLDTSRSISLLRQELIIHGESKDWDKVNAVFANYLDELKTRMVRGKRPVKVAGAFMPVINYKTRSGLMLDQQLHIVQLLNDVIIPGGYILNNNNLNEVSVVLLSDIRTFEYGLKLIERKLIGGYIARQVLKGRQWRDSAQPLGSPPIKYQNEIRPPRLYLKDDVYIKVAIHISNYLSLRYKTNPDNMSSILTNFRIKFTKVCDNFPTTIEFFEKKLRSK